MLSQQTPEQTINLELTKNCNFACNFCSIINSSQKSKTPIYLIDKTIEICKPLNRSINLNLTGGESFPILTPSMTDKLIASIPNLHNITIHTNAYTIPSINLFSKLQNITLKIPLYGKKNFYEKMTNTPHSYSTVISNVRTLKLMGYNIILTTPIFNLHESLKLATLSKKLNLPIEVKYFFGSNDCPIPSLPLERQEKIVSQMIEINPLIRTTQKFCPPKDDLQIPTIKFTGELINMENL